MIVIRHWEASVAGMRQGVLVVVIEARQILGQLSGEEIERDPGEGGRGE